MKEKLRSVMKYAPLGLLTLILTAYFMFLTFPFNSLEQDILPTLEENLPFRISVEDIAATPLLWIKLTGVRLLPKTAGGSPFLDVPELRIRPSLLALMIGNLKLRIRADLLDGTLKGKIARSKAGDVDLALKWDEINPGRHPLLSRNPATQMAGGLAGTLKIKMKGDNWLTTDGTMALDLSAGALKGVQVSGFTIPEVQNMTGEAEAKVEKQKVELKSLALKSDQASASLSGDIQLSPRWASSRLSLTGKLKLSGKIQDQYQVMLDGFLKKKDSEGSQFSIKGTLGRPQFNP